MKIKKLRKEFRKSYNLLPEDFRNECFKKWDMTDIENMSIVEFLECVGKMNEIGDVLKLMCGGVTK